MYGEDGMDTMKVPFLNAKHIAFLDANRHVIENEEMDEKLQNDHDVERKIQKHKKAVIYLLFMICLSHKLNFIYFSGQIVAKKAW